LLTAGAQSPAKSFAAWSFDRDSLVLVVVEGTIAAFRGLDALGFPT